MKLFLKCDIFFFKGLITNLHIKECWYVSKQWERFRVVWGRAAEYFQKGVQIILHCAQVWGVTGCGYLCSDAVKVRKGMCVYYRKWWRESYRRERGRHICSFIFWEYSTAESSVKPYKISFSRMFPFHFSFVLGHKCYMNLFYMNFSARVSENFWKRLWVISMHWTILCLLVKLKCFNDRSTTFSLQKPIP
jgi:hypothetical protein